RWDVLRLLGSTSLVEHLVSRSVQILRGILSHWTVGGQTAHAAEPLHDGSRGVHARLKGPLDPAAAPPDAVARQEDPVRQAQKLIVEGLVHQILAWVVEFEGPVVLLLVLPIDELRVLRQGG